MEPQNHRRVDIPLVRFTDKRPVGTLTLIRSDTWVLYDESGRRLPTPRHQDTLIVTLSRPDGEQVIYTHIPIAELLGEDQ